MVWADEPRVLGLDLLALAGALQLIQPNARRCNAWLARWPSSCLGMLCVVDGEPSLWPHTNKHDSDPVPRVFDVPVAQFGAEITVREWAPIALKVCRFHRDDWPLH